MKRSLFALLILFAGGVLQAQSRQWWVDFKAQKELQNNFEFATALSWRQAFPDPFWRRQKLDLSSKYAYKKIKFHGSISVLHTAEEGDGQLWELRPWQGVELQFPHWEILRFYHLVRFEERFQLEDGVWSFSPRLRIESSMLLALNQKSFSAGMAYLFAGIEWLNNFSRPLQERFSSNRAYAIGPGFYLRHGSQIELLYEMDQTDDLRENLIDVDVHIIRFRWLQSLN